MSLRFETLSTNFQTGALQLPSDVLMSSTETPLPADRARLLVRGGAPQAASMAAGGELDDGSEELGAVQVQSSGTAFWPWSMWAKSEPAASIELAAAGEHAMETPKLSARPAGSQRSSARNNSAQAGASRTNATAECIPSSYKARWPSLWCRVVRWMRVFADLYFFVALIVIYATPKPAPDSPQVWRMVKAYGSAFVWIPFLYRFFTGFLHWVLALVIMPGSILYMHGPALKLLPKGLQESINENNSARAKRREELIADTHGTPILLLTPDGVELDAVYWAGRGASRDGPTIVRLNGNAEAFELQDDILPLMYCTKGINVLLFNYRGVGGSGWAPVCGSDWIGHLLGLWSVPQAAGLQLDAWSAIDFLLHQQRVPPEKICIVGHSIGGAIAAKFLAQHPHLPIALCCSRSFAYMSCIAGELAPLFLGIPPTSRKAAVVSSLTSGLVILSGWQHKSLDNFHKATGKKWLEYCTEDHIIPLHLSLPAAVRDRHLKACRRKRHAAGGDGGVEECAELEDLPEGLVTLAGFKCMRLIGLQTIDNHNRLWLNDEILIHVQLVKEALATAGGTTMPVLQQLQPSRYAV